MILIVLGVAPPYGANDYEGRQWKTDFQSVKLHIQDELGTLSKSGNIFLTNIHRVYQKTERSGFERNYQGTND